MMFENLPSPSPSNWTSFKQHLPIVLLVLGIALAFVGLHAAVTGLVALGLLHLFGAAAVFGVRYLGPVRRGGSA